MGAYSCDWAQGRLDGNGFRGAYSCEGAQGRLDGDGFRGAYCCEWAQSCLEITYISRRLRDD